MHLMGERVHLPHSFRLQTITVGRQGQRRNGTCFLLACFAFSLLSNAIQDTVPGVFCCWKWPESVNNQTPTTQTCPLAILICIMPQ